MSDIILGQTIRIRVTFRDWVDEDSEGLIDPDVVNGRILDGDLEPWPPGDLDFTGLEGPGYPPPGDFTPTRESLGIYIFDWTPVLEGDYYVEFDGEFETGATPEDDSHNIVREAFTVVAGPGSTIPAETLGQDQYIEFMPELTPIYIDPQEILLIFPDASPIEVNELLYFYSYEINLLLDGAAFTTLAYDYLKAAVLCSLSRVFDISNASGSSDIDSLTLGDLSIKSGTTTTTSSSSGVNLGNATSWCELALLLRRELTFTRIGFKAVEKGTNFPNPIPSRSIDRTRVN